MAGLALGAGARVGAEEQLASVPLAAALAAEGAEPGAIAEPDLVQGLGQEQQQRQQEQQQQQQHGPCKSDAERFRLLDAAFDEIGAGRYHVALFMAAALGFFVEAAEMSMLGLLLAEFERVWDVKQTDLSIIASFTGIGMALGTVVCGRLSDVIGRKLVYQASLATCVLFGFLSSFTSSVQSFAIMRLFLGFGYGGNTVSSATLMVESVPTSWRGFFSAMNSFSFTFGGLFASLLSWSVMDSWGWASVVRFVSIIGVPAVLVLLVLPGSPRFSVIKRDYEGAVSIVTRIAQYNGVPCPAFFTLANLQGIDAPAQDQLGAAKPSPMCSGLVKSLSGAHARTLVLLIVIWFLNSFGQSMIQFLPLEMEQRFPEVTDTRYKVAFGLALGSLFGSCVVLYTSSRVMRRKQLRFGLCLIAACLAFLSVYKAEFALIMVVLLFTHVGMSLVFHSLYTYTPEVFPTSVRVTSFSLCQLAHRLAPVLSPFLVTTLAVISFKLSGLVFASIFLLAAAISFLLRRETLNRSLVEEHDAALDDDLDAFPTVEFKPVQTVEISLMGEGSQLAGPPAKPAYASASYSSTKYSSAPTGVDELATI